MASTKKQIPRLRSEDDERKFWAKNDSTEFIDWQSGERRKFSKLKPSLRTISLRLPVEDPGQQARCSLSVSAQGLSGRALGKGAPDLLLARRNKQSRLEWRLQPILAALHKGKIPELSVYAHRGLGYSIRTCRSGPSTM